MSAIRAERDYVVHEDFMKVHRLTLFKSGNQYASTQELTLNFWCILGCQEAERCQEVRIQCPLQRRLWQRVRAQYS
jgi:hypothetical protein